jgi:hypothetical protein
VSGINLVVRKLLCADRTFSTSLSAFKPLTRVEPTGQVCGPPLFLHPFSFLLWTCYHHFHHILKFSSTSLPESNPSIASPNIIPST